MHLAEMGKMDMEQARKFTGKSMRCGGVSEAAANAVRDGVLQGHGGWLCRASLVNYDLIKDGEREDVSHALNTALEAVKHSARGQSA